MIVRLPTAVFWPIRKASANMADARSGREQRG
jgi:hypothetical protein